MITRIKKVMNEKADGKVMRFAKEIGLSQQTVWNYMSETRQPTVEFVRRITARYPDVSADWLISGTKRNQSEPKGTIEAIDRLLSLVEQMRAELNDLKRKSVTKV